MKQIKVREFQRQFYSLVTAKEDFEVVNTSGVIIGYWKNGGTSGTIKLDGTLTAKQKPSGKKGNIFNADRDNKGKGIPVEEFEKALHDCDKCPRLAKFIHIIEVNGIPDNRYRCAECFKSYPLKNLLKPIGVKI